MMEDNRSVASPATPGVLGSLPSGWNRERLRRVAQVKLSSVNKKTVEGERPVRLCNYTDVYYQDRVTGGLDLMQATASDSDVADLHLQAGDVIITKDSESWDDIGVPTYVEETLPEVVCGYHLALLRPDLSSLVGRFLHYALMSRIGAAQFHISAQGVTRYGLTQDAIKNVVVPLPPVRQQRAIAEFLDEKTAGIDRIVEDKKRLIERLEEKRLALIYEAVTGRWADTSDRVEPDVAWIDRLPGHWAMSPVFARFEVQLGKMLNQKAASGEHQAPYLRNVDVRWGRVDVDDLPTMSFMPHERSKYELRPGDLLVCEGGEVGRSAVWQGEMEECFYQKALHRVRPRDPNRDLPRFLYYLMRAAAACGVLSAEGDTSTITHLTAEKLSRLRLPFPPVEEQREIVDRLETEVARLDQVASDIQHQLARLQEYRSSLITAAVTGQIDVRASTPALA